jgi:uncharacterized membrane protein (DUF4010 family)
MNELTRTFAPFAISLAIGLLVGLERERNPLTKAGVRTFALIALLGTVAALVASELHSAWIVGAAVVSITVALAGAYFVDSRTAADDSGTTTVTAALAVFLLGVVVFLGHWLLAVTLGVAITALLHFKPELEGISRRLTVQDTRSMLQFAILTAVVLPLLPNEAYGPYGVLNPFQMGLMVVLISAVSLAGYVAWRTMRRQDERAWRANLLVTGVLGGIVSSTATTLVFARHAKTGTMSVSAALVVIVLANATMLVRLLLFTTIVAPGAVVYVAACLVPAVALTLPTLMSTWRLAGPDTLRTDEPYRNPTNLLVALAFVAGYGVVLLLSAWFSETLGQGALFGLAAVAGLTDVDAISLSALQLFRAGAVDAVAGTTAIAIAVGANLVMKAGLVASVCGIALGKPTARAFVGPLLGLAAGVVGLYLLR